MSSRSAGLVFLVSLVISYLGMGTASLLAQASQSGSNPFGVGRAASEPEQTQPVEPRPNPFGNAAAPVEPKSEPLFVMPASLRVVFRQIADWQRQINRYLARQLQATNDQGGFGAALTVVLASFVYGVLHAAGPGHGKMVVASYFTAKDAPLRRGILMGGVIATTQAVVAIVMVAVLALLLQGSQLEIIDRTALLEVVSYGFILIIGLYMTYGAVTGKATCGHDHSDDRGHDHHHDDHPGHSHGPDPAAKETWLARTAGRWLGPRGEVIAIGIVSGMRPCTGSILVLLFAAANGVFILGIVASFMMAAGVAITISVLGIGAIVLRRSVAGQADEEPSPARAFLGRALSVAGSLAVALMGGLLFGGALERTGFLV
ncbi:MAG: hypothetical protein HN793_05460 [Rhodospirillaceae bacterium]|nr:hypothetical protein [Rhodospirillaceae bacterium]MBT5566903.1 hypothetical protein [Rhodospirillaceae bacterium]MBT6090410.1 hypothetical protein [Rhodospirillaceae bacterium]MBT6960617.1 hypothetical protein [Rhodospirillaceae bacterium]MBT7450259.1 hypothetical protein [Rhodospirillaceae bacterium]